MSSEDEWHAWLIAFASLEPDAAKELRESGFAVIPGPRSREGAGQMRLAYDRAVAKADPRDVHMGRTRSSTRIDDFVNRDPEFDAIYTYMPLLAACTELIGRPFKLSGMLARTLHPGAHQEKLHVDVPSVLLVGRYWDASSWLMSSRPKTVPRVSFREATFSRSRQLMFSHIQLKTTKIR